MKVYISDPTLRQDFVDTLLEYFDVELVDTCEEAEQCIISGQVFLPKGLLVYLKPKYRSGLYSSDNRGILVKLDILFYRAGFVKKIPDEHSLLIVDLSLGVNGSRALYNWILTHSDPTKKYAYITEVYMCPEVEQVPYNKWKGEMNGHIPKSSGKTSNTK